MKVKTLIESLQEFDPEMEVWLFDVHHQEESKPNLPIKKHDPEENIDFVSISFGYPFLGN